MNFLDAIQLLSAAMLAAFVLLFGVAVLTTTVLRKMDKARRQPERDDPTIWHTFWQQR